MCSHIQSYRWLCTGACAIRASTVVGVYLHKQRNWHCHCRCHCLHMYQLRDAHRYTFWGTQCKHETIQIQCGGENFQTTRSASTLCQPRWGGEWGGGTGISVAGLRHWVRENPVEEDSDFLGSNYCTCSFFSFLHITRCFNVIISLLVSVSLLHTLTLSPPAQHKLRGFNSISGTN